MVGSEEAISQDGLMVKDLNGCFAITGIRSVCRFTAMYAGKADAEDHNVLRTR